MKQIVKSQIVKAIASFSDIPLNTDMMIPNGHEIIIQSNKLKYSALLMAFMYDAFIIAAPKSKTDIENFYILGMNAWNMAVLRQQGLLNKNNSEAYFKDKTGKIFKDNRDFFETLIIHKIKEFGPYMGYMRNIIVRFDGEQFFVKVIFSHKSQKDYEAEEKYGWPVFIEE